MLLSKDYVNTNAAKEFQLDKDLPVEFLLIMSAANVHKFKKVGIVKDFLSAIVDHVPYTACNDMI